ncbi:MAG: fabD [Frankiales bacterium]|nr:fabD [Frankiales bacterium]
MSTAFVFPGQGSQRPGMGAPWAGSACWSLVEEASDLLGRDMGRLLLQADAEELRATREAQVTTFLVSLLVWETLHDLPDVAVVAGHSLGEFTALVAAGVLTCDDGLHLVGERGAAMQEAADAAPGTMAAVLGLEDDAVAAALVGVESVWPANYNAPSHVVVSGTGDGVAAGGQVLKASGARRVLPLPVGGAFHTPLMEPARRRLDVALREVTFAEAAVPVLSAVTALPYDDDPAAALSQQLTAPVRWRQVLEALPAYGVDRVVELGPGGVLTGLVRRTLPGVQAVSIASPADLALLD